MGDVWSVVTCGEMAEGDLKRYKTGHGMILCYECH